MRIRRKCLTHISIIFMTITMCITLISPNYNKVEAATHKLTENQLYTLCPEYLNNTEVEEYLSNARDLCDLALEDSTNYEGMSAIIESLKNGDDYIVNKVTTAMGLTESESDKINKELAQLVLEEYFESKEYNQILGSAASKYSALTKTKSLMTEAGRVEYKNSLKKLPDKKLTDAQIDNLMDATFESDVIANKVLGYFGKADKMWEFMTSSIVLYDMEISGIVQVMSVVRQDTSLYRGLEAIYKERTKDPARYIIDNYFKDVFIGKICSKIDKLISSGLEVGGVIESGTLILLAVDLTGIVIAKIYDWLGYPSAKDIICANYLLGYCDTAQGSCDKAYVALVTDPRTFNIDAYITAYHLKLICLKYYCKYGQNVTRNKDYKNRLATYEGAINNVVCYEYYIDKCLAAATKAINAGTLKISGSNVVKKTDTGTVIDENYDSTESIAAKMAVIQQQYKPNVGQTWTGTFNGCYQCCGFAQLVFYKLFGVKLSGYYGDRRYMIRVENKVNKVGQLIGSEVTTSNVKQMFSNAKVGDYIQMNGANWGQHSAIVAGVDDTGVMLYDCNSKPHGETTNCLINQWKITWANWVSWYGKPSSASNNGISVYRAKNYAEIYGDGSGLFYDDTVNFVIENGVLKKYNGWQTYVKIPEEVTAIGNSAFANNTIMMDVEIPNTVKSIGDSAFSGCTSLLGVNIPDSVESIGSSAFYNCTSLTNAHLPENEQFVELKGSAFAYNTSLRSVLIPNCVIKINSQAFYKCGNLEDVDLPNKLVEVGRDAFYDCDKISSIIIPKSLESAGGGYDGPFTNCDGLKKVYFENGVTEIVPYLFSNCTGIEEIRIPDTVTKIDYCAFYVCENLRKVEIPSSVTQIKNEVFYNCSSIVEINIPDTVTYMGTYAFFGCTSLEKAHIPNTRIDLPNCTFQNCTSLTEVNLPDTLETIGAGAFQNCTSLTEINLPSKVNTINSSAFSGCTGLTKVTIPESMRTIDSSAFSHCEALTNLKIAEGTTKIYSNAFEYCSSLESVFLPDTLQELGSYAFRYCDKLSTVKIGAGLRVIPSYCFYEDPALEEIVLPQQVTTVNSYAFGNCTKFKDITMNRRVSAITANAFSYPDRLTIHGVSGTYAHTFANENGITFVSLNTPATAIHLNKTECQVGRGYTIQLTAGVTPENSSDELTWTSTDEEILTVDENGLVKGKKNGAASVIVMAGDVIETCEVTVFERVSSVYVNPSSKEMTIGENLQLTATVYPSDATNKNITWKSDDESIATVSAGGVVTAKAYGTAKITVTTEDGARTATVTISVKPIAVTGITLNKKTVTVGIGKTYQLKANILPENASIKDVTWTSSKPAVVTVENGLLTGVGEGTSIIIAKTVDGAKTASCTVTVKDLSVTGVSIPETSVEVPAGDVHLLKASIMPEDAYNKNVTWTCDDESVATVDAATGLVTGISEGTATMTVTTEDGGYTASCTVTVTAEPENITKVEAIVAEETDAELEEGEDITLSVTFMPEDATNKNVIWISSDETVATVDENGKVTAIGAGDVIITAVSENGGKTATFEFIIKGTETGGQPTETPDNPNIDDPNEDDPNEDNPNIDNPNEDDPSGTGEEQKPSGGQNPGTSGGGQNPGSQQNPNGSGGQPDPSGGQQGGNATQNVPVSKIAITGISKKITIDKKVALRADVLPANATNKGIIWTSSNTQFATVNDKGIVTAKKKGIGKTVIITATAGDGSGVRADYKIAIVKHAVKSIKLSTKSNTVTAGKNLKLKTTVKTTGKTANKTLVWSSSNEKYATVTNKGVVKTKKAGKGKTVKITAMATDGTGKKAAIKIKIK